jgi:hypothetical protein
MSLSGFAKKAFMGALMVSASACSVNLGFGKNNENSTEGMTAANLQGMALQQQLAAQNLQTAINLAAARQQSAFPAYGCINAWRQQVPCGGIIVSPPPVVYYNQPTYQPAFRRAASGPQVRIQIGGTPAHRPVRPARPTRP